MEKPPAALAQRRGTPQGPATVKTETQFNAQGLPTKQVKTTEIHTPGFKAHDVSAFEAGQDSALRNAAKGEDHHRTNNAPTPLKPGESSLTLTEETRFNAQGEPAVSTRKTESVATQALKSDKNGNGVQVVRTQQEVTRGPKDSPSTDTAPALTPKTPGAVNQRTTVTGYDPDGSHFDAGHASRSRTVTQSSGTVDAHGQMQLKHQPTQVQSLQEASDNRWRYDHVGFDVGADGKPVPGQEPRQLDKERQLPWYEDATEFVGDELKALADTADDIADAASDFVTAPLQEALTDEIQKLDSAGDSVSLSGNLDVKVGLKGGISGEAAIERTEDGKYQLSAEVTADVGVGLLGSASVGAGGRMEWMFNTPEEAAKAALTLGKGPSALAPGSEGHTFLRDHLSAMEVNVTGEVEAGIGGGLGTGSAELSASLGATGGLRVEFDKGKPTHLVKSVSFEGSGAAGAATGLKGKADLNLGGEVSGSVSIETKTPLDASKLDGNDVLSFLTGDKSDALVGPSETSITVEGSVDRGNQGQYFTAEVSGLTDKEVQSVTDKLKAGKFENAFDDLKKEAKVTQGSFKDRELAVGAKLGVVDFELSARHRDVTAEDGGGGGGNGSTTVSLGGGKRRGGSDGPSGSHGSTGGPNRSTGNEATGGTGPSAKKPGNTSTGGDGQPGSKDGEKPSAKLPANTTEVREPPTVYRVNPATGRLGPVPPQDGGPARAGRSEKPGAPVPGAESRPPRTEEQGETSPPAGRRPVPVVRNPELPGRTTHVRYDDGKVRIEAGPDATDKDIQAHMETARVLQRYEGAVGKVRQLIDKVKQVLTGMPGYGSQGFESRLEVKKLSSILQDLESTQAQLNRDIAGATGSAMPTTDAQRKGLEKRISSLESQLRTHEAQVDSLSSGRGYVAQVDDVTPSSEVENPALAWNDLNEFFGSTGGPDGNEFAVQVGSVKMFFPADPAELPVDVGIAPGETPNGAFNRLSQTHQEQVRNAIAARIKQADELLAEYQTSDPFKRLTRDEVLSILSAESLRVMASDALSMKNKLETIEAALKMFKDFETRSDPAYFPSVATTYKLDLDMMGESAHVRAAWLMSPNPHSVRYIEDGSGNRFEPVLHPPARDDGTHREGPSVVKLRKDEPPPPITEKQSVNAEQIAPRTVNDPVGMHEKVLRDHLANIDPRKLEEIRNTVWSQFPKQGAGESRERIGVWIRNVPEQTRDNGKAPAQNMTKERFIQIVEDARKAGIKDIILLGDPLPPQELKEWIAAATPKKGEGDGSVYQFNALWDGDPGGNRTESLRNLGISEQVAVYEALYKDPNAMDGKGTNPNMQAIVTNKSGGPDIASLAGIPQIQLAEMSADESFVLHRMGFQSLTSHAWSVLKIPKRKRGVLKDDLKALKGPIDAELRRDLVKLIKRSVRVRKYHLKALASGEGP
ncbi:hypothetical protein [Corallococcus sp. AB011P]|uniref:hypothetical protein n=1 Tax=Corallococcus sp. AB011P TaxID=2316735 RepID=UPI0011C36D3D|nr:hypothetical protein [Corallococcus sp. AB011P]